MGFGEVVNAIEYCIELLMPKYLLGFEIFYSIVMIVVLLKKVMGLMMITYSLLYLYMCVCVCVHFPCNLCYFSSFTF